MNSSKEIIEKTVFVNRYILLKIAGKDQNRRDYYLRNSLAKATTLIISIDLLYSQGLISEGWSLYRNLIDRLIYIYYLMDNDLFEIFESTTKINVYEYNNTVKADELMVKKIKDDIFNATKDQANDYKNEKNKKLKFIKPDPKSVLKGKHLDFVYKYGYDYASSRVHPNFDDGLFEFHSLTGLKPNPYNRFDNSLLIQDSILIYSVLSKEIMSGLSQNFRAIVYTFFTDSSKYYLDEKNNFLDSFQKIQLLMYSELDLFE